MEKEKLHNINDKAKYEEAFFQIGRCLEAFNVIMPNIPKYHIKVVENIIGRYDDAMYATFRASNTYDHDEKIKYLTEAISCLFFQQSSFFTLVRLHACTVGQINTVIDLTKNAYTQLDKWKTSVIKDTGSSR